MHPLFEKILSKIESDDPVYGSRLRERLSRMDENYARQAADYFTRYDAALRSEGKTIDFGIDCYLKLCNDMTEERANFMRTGKYANSSYKEVERKIYANPAIMDYHMHGLALAQYLWPEQYVRLEFFRANLPIYIADCAAYLEVGGGHGLYAWTALQQLAGTTRLDLVDISPSSISLARRIIGSSRVKYVLRDIFAFEAASSYDFITAGEIIEHLENPLGFLQKLEKLLRPRGTIYFTTSINAPMIDHIYLFNNAQEIRDLIAAAGLRIVAEKTAASRDLPERLLFKQKIPVMFAAFLQKA
jgi:2-polyprenyl-3-methyl-5-hydroxy-6-metoxy-1,4-benzoquinol methylase